MNITVTDQLFIFTSCTVCGVIIGLLFDIFRIFRRLVKASKTAAVIEDITYWLIAAFVFFLFVVRVNSGELRFYQFIGAICGTFVYFVTVSKYVIKISVGLIYCITNALGFIIRIILTPLIFILKLLRKPFFFIISISKKSCWRVKRRFKYSISNFYKYIKKI